jgi:nucleoid-associated protein YgaU
MSDNSGSSTSSSGQVKAKLIIIQPDAATSLTDDGVTGTEIPCQFNPSSLKVTKPVNWHPEDEGHNQGGGKKVEQQSTKPLLNAPMMVFGGGNSATFSLDLIFDTTGEGNTDVRTYTNQLLQLTLICSGKESPPYVLFIWGEYSSFLSVVTRAEVTYTHFLGSGRPVRARANVTFTQASDTDGGQLPSQNPTSLTEARKTHIVRQGERIDTLAYREYRSCARWRDIAEANGLDNPMDLRPGQILVIPQLD